MKVAIWLFSKKNNLSFFLYKEKNIFDYASEIQNVIFLFR